MHACTAHRLAGSHIFSANACAPLEGQHSGPSTTKVQTFRAQEICTTEEYKCSGNWKRVQIHMHALLMGCSISTGISAELATGYIIIYEHHKKLIVHTCDVFCRMKSWTCSVTVLIVPRTNGRVHSEWNVYLRMQITYALNAFCVRLVVICACFSEPVLHA